MNIVELREAVMRGMGLYTGAFLCAGLGWAQNGFQLSEWNAAHLADARVKPVLRCADLRSLTSDSVSITTARLIPARGDMPEYCRVRGQILPEVGFEVDLPSSWNGRLYMFGNGGFAGEPFDGRPHMMRVEAPVRQGFVAASTDTGHSQEREPGGAFAADEQKFLDYCFRSLHVTAEEAKALAKAYYGTSPAHSYYDGCSTGGRQGLILAQRFPADFDGITVGAPVLNFSGTMVSYVWYERALAGARIPVSKLKLLADRIYTECDAKDGLKDGLIDDPRRCDFQPARDLPQCQTGADGASCFTPAQTKALEQIYSDVMSQGKRYFPRRPVGAEAIAGGGRSGWDPWIVRDDAPTTGARFSQTFFAYMAFPRKDPEYDISRFNFDRDVPRLEAVHEALDATDSDLSAFQRRGGKMVMYFGWADPALNPLMGVEYYESVRHKIPNAQDFFRLFMVPGMFHCGGGIGPNEFDAFTAMVKWVERSEPPDHLLASRRESGKVVRTRPLCPYPQVARYQGKGSIDDAAHFHCVAPPPVDSAEQR